MIYGYARVSTTDQNLDGQVEQLMVAGAGRIYQEKVSGAKDDRPELSKLLSIAKRGDMVVVTKMDRLARSVQHLLYVIGEFEKNGVSFKTLYADIDTSTPVGRLMLTVLGAIAEFERSIMLERQREGIDRAKKEGRYKGANPKALSQSEKILSLLSGGMKPMDVALECGIGIASVYRIKGRK